MTAGPRPFQVVPRCRYCHCRVTNFGDICGGDEAREDGLLQIVRNDITAMLARQAGDE